MFCYEILNSLEFAMKTLGEAIIEAKEDYVSWKKKANDMEMKEYQ